MLSLECSNFLSHATRNARFPVIIIGDSHCVVTPHALRASKEGRNIPVITVNGFATSRYPLEEAHAFLCATRTTESPFDNHSLFMCSSQVASRLITAPISLIHLANGTAYAEVKDAFLMWAAKVHPQGWFIIQDSGTASPWEGPKKVVEEILYNPDSVPLKWGNIQVGSDFTALQRLR